MQKDILSHMVFSISTETHLNVGAQFLEDLIDLILEPSTQHLVSFIQYKHLDVFCT